MATNHRLFYLVPRKSKKSETGVIWYYRMHNETTKHSTGCEYRDDAESYVGGMIFDETRKIREANEQKLFDYARQFYLWDTCPHVTRKRRLGKRITRRYVDQTRKLLESEILKHKICRKPLREIKRGDILDFQADMAEKHSPHKTNSIMKILSLILKTAHQWQLIGHNPAVGVGQFKVEKEEVGTFTEKELNALFTNFEWSSLIEKVCFSLSAFCGMRRGEILALLWSAVDLEKGVITVDRAVKRFSKNRQNDEFGPPKSGRPRIVPIPKIVSDLLVEFQKGNAYVMPQSFVLTHSDGRLFSTHEWRSSFVRNMSKAGFIKRTYVEDKRTVIDNPRNLRPHSFRHSLNTILLSHGADPNLLRATFGWTTEQVQGDYTHWKPEFAAPQVNLIDEITGLAPKPSDESNEEKEQSKSDDEDAAVHEVG